MNGNVCLRDELERFKGRAFGVPGAEDSKKLAAKSARKSNSYLEEQKALKEISGKE